MSQQFSPRPGDPAPNYVNPEIRAPVPQVISSILAFLVVTSTVLRIYTRVRVSSYVGLDDLFAIMGAVCS